LLSSIFPLLVQQKLEYVRSHSFFMEEAGTSYVKQEKGRAGQGGDERAMIRVGRFLATVIAPMGGTLMNGQST
jgi:hypothetical protein